LYGESRIFISHAKEDNHILIRILKILDDEGIENWVDIKRLNKLDTNVNENINYGLSSCNYFLLLWSKNAKKSKYVTKEYNCAISQDYDKRLKKIILRLDNTILPALLADKMYHRVDDESLEKVVLSILKELKPNNNRIKQRKFDNFLNASYEPIKIMDIEYKPALAFKRVDRKRYNQELEDWREND
jgi:hypothetical protein